MSIPLTVSGEMVPFSHHVGELRAHYAGFFDPGFGYGREGELKGAVGVLEVRPHETITIYDGQVSTVHARLCNKLATMQSCCMLQFRNTTLRWTFIMRCFV